MKKALVRVLVAFASALGAAWLDASKSDDGHRLGTVDHQQFGEHELNSDQRRQHRAAQGPNEDDGMHPWRAA
jgi:hypothetical protein